MFRQGVLAVVGSIAMLPVFRGPAGAGEAAWQAEILRKLERPMTFKGREAAAPMLSLERAVGCKIIRDKSFRRGNVPVVFAHGMPARAVLDWVCHFTNGEWMLRDGGIVLCSAEEAWRLHQHPKRVYDLTLAGLPPGDAEALRKLAEQILGPPSGAFGGRATLTPDGRLEIIAPQAKQQVIAITTIKVV